MGFKYLYVLALFCLTLVGNVASLYAEDLQLPYRVTNVPINANEKVRPTTLFFLNDLYPGKKMSGLKRLSNVQTFRSIGWIPNGNAIEKQSYSLDEICDSPANIGAVRYCASSLESMRDFVISTLGSNVKKILGSFSHNHDQYVVGDVKKVADKGVDCHRLNIPKVVFFCHQVNATTSYMVQLVASDGTEVKALVVCHHDTRGMNPSYLYEVLKVKPGTVPVCHFVGNKVIAWIPNDVASDADDRSHAN